MLLVIVLLVIGYYAWIW